jgi:hypothetical protein
MLSRRLLKPIIIMQDFIKIDNKFKPYCDHEYANREDNAANCTETSLEISIAFAEWVIRQDITNRGIGYYVNYIGEIVSTKDLFITYYKEMYIEPNQAE